MSSMAKNASLSLVGTLSSVQKALKFVQLDGSTISTEHSTLTLTATDNTGAETSLELALLLVPSASSGFLLTSSISEQEYSTGALNVNKTSVGLLSGVIQLSRTEFSVQDEQSLMQAVVRSDAGRGEIATTSRAALWAAPVERKFMVTIEGQASSSPAVHQLTLDVPWRYEQQAVEFHTPDGKVLSASVDCEVSLSVYNITDAVSFVVDARADLRAIASAFSSAISELRNVGEVEVAVRAPNSTSASTLLGTLYVTFLGNSGDVPLLAIAPWVTTPALHIRTVEVSKGSTTAEVQNVTLTAPTDLSSGNFVLVFTHDQYRVRPSAANVWSDGFMETGLLSYDATTAEVEHALSQIAGIGLVQVTDGLAAPHSKSWSVTFLTYGSDVAPLIAVSSAGSSDEQLYRTKLFSSEFFEPFSSNQTEIVVSTSVSGTQSLNGAFYLAMTSTNSNGQQSVLATTAPIALDSSPLLLARAIEELPGVIRASAKMLDVCSIEGRCTWFIDVNTDGRYPQFSLDPVTEALVGTDASMRCTAMEREVLAPTGSFQLAVLLDKGGKKIITEAIAYNATASAVSNVVNNVLARTGFVASAERTFSIISAKKSSLQYVIAISASGESADLPAGSVHQSIGGTAVLLLRATDLPVIELHDRDSRLTGSQLTLAVAEADSALSAKHGRYLLSLRRPEVASVAEVQRIVCGSNASLPEDGLLQSALSPDMLSFSFRNASTAPIWIHSFVSPNLLPSCSDPVLNTGVPCAGDGSTLQEHLQALTSLPYVTISTNSTSGRVCPSAEDRDAAGQEVWFETRLTFVNPTTVDLSLLVGASGGQVSAMEVYEGSTGDVPLVTADVSALSVGTFFLIDEATKGVAPDVREVQLVTLFASDARSAAGSTEHSAAREPAGSFHLHYNSSDILVAADASNAEFAAAVAWLIGAAPTEVHVSKNANYSLADGNEYSATTRWQVTFPAAFGRAHLLQVRSHCEMNPFVGNATAAGGLLAEQTTWFADYWEGSSCMLPRNNRFQSQRVVSGYTVLTGSVELQVSANTLVAPLASFASSLQSQLRALPGLEAASVIKHEPDGGGVWALYVLDFSKTYFGSVAVPAIDSSQIALSYPLCAVDPSTDSLAVEEYLLRKRSLTQSPCFLPFEHNGQLLSTCAERADRSGSYKMCSLVPNLTMASSTNGASEEWGRCVPCLNEATAAWDFAVTLSPFASEARWVGNLEQLQETLSGLVYAPRSDVYSSALTEDSGAPLAKLDYVSVIVVGDADRETIAQEAEVPVRIAIHNDVPQLLRRGVMVGAEGDPLYAFEDSVLQVTGLSVFDDSYPTLSAQMLGMVGVNLSVEHGDLFLQHHDRILFPRSDNRTGQLAFYGALTDVNNALASLVYKPYKDWNSANATEPLASVQRVVFSAAHRAEVQVISTVLQVEGGPPSPQLSGSVNASSYFTLVLDCAEYALSVFGDAPSNDTVPAVATNMLFWNASAELVQTEISVLIDTCDATIGVVSAHTQSFEQKVKPVVTRSTSRFVRDLDTYTWAVEFLSGPLQGRFPLLTVGEMQIHPYMRDIDGHVLHSGSVTIETRYSGSNEITGVFRLGFCGSYTSDLSVSSDASALQTALRLLPCVNADDVEVVRSEVDIPSLEVSAVVFEVRFLHKSNWPRSAVDSKLLPAYAYGPMPTALEVDASGLRAVGLGVHVSVIATGLATPDALRVVTTDFGSGGSVEQVSTSTIPIYVLPVQDLPVLQNAPSVLEVLEDSSAVLRALQYKSADRVAPTATLRLVVSAPFATLTLPSLSSLTSLSVTHYCSGLEVSSFTSSSSCQTAQGSSANRIELLGDLPSINAALLDAVYTSIPDFYGNTSVVFALSVLEQTTSRSTQVSVVVFPVLDEPTIELASAHLALQTSSVSALPRLQIRDPDSLFALVDQEANSADFNALTVTLSVGSGMLRVPVLMEAAPGQFQPSDWTTDSMVVLTGQFRAINTILEFVQYQSGSESVEDTLTVVLQSLNAESTVRATLTIRVVPDALTPQLEVQTAGVVSIDEDSQWFVAERGVQIKSTSGAESEALLEVLIMCETGVLSISTAHLDEVSGVELLSSGKVLHLRGNSLRALNRAVQGMVFIPPRDYFGSVLISVSAMLDPVSATPSIAYGQVMVLVQSVDDPPVVTLRPSPALSGEPVIAPIVTEFFRVSDIDDTQLMKVVLQTERGSLLLPNSVLDDPSIELFAVEDQPSNDTALVFMVEPRLVAVVLNQIVYTPPALYRGKDALTLILTSQELNTQDPAAALPAATAVGISLRTGEATVSTLGVGDTWHVSLYVPTSEVVKTVTLTVNSPSLMKLACAESVTAFEDETFVLGDVCALHIELSNSEILSAGEHSNALNVDADQGLVTLTISLDEGFLTLSPEIGSAEFESDWYTVSQGVSAEGSDASSDHYSELTVSLRARYVSALLSYMEIGGAEDYNGEATVAISASYRPHGLSEDARLSTTPVSAVAVVPLVFLPVNDAPVVIVAVEESTSFNASTQELHVSSSSELVLSFIALEDVDLSEGAAVTGGLEGWLDVTISAQLGVIAVVPALALGSGVYVADDGHSTGSGLVHLVSTDYHISALLQTGAVVYHPPSFAQMKALLTEGSNELHETIVIAASDNGFYGSASDAPAVVEERIDLVIVLEQIPVSAVVASDLIVGVEDEPIFLHRNLSINAGTFGDDVALEVQLHSNSGRFSYPGSEARISISEGTVLTMQGTARDLRSAMAALVFTPQRDVCLFVEASFEVRHFSAFDHSSSYVTSREAVMFYLVPVNDAPVVTTTQPMVRVEQGASFNLDSGGFVVTDVDVSMGPVHRGTGKVHARIAAPCGGIVLREPNAALVRYALHNPHWEESVSLVGNSAMYSVDELCSDISSPDRSPADLVLLGYRSIEIDGHIDAVNLIIHSLTFVAPQSFIGATKISLTVSDKGNFGSNGRAETAEGVLAVEISPALRAPQLLLNHHLRVPGGGGMVFGRSILLSLSDADASPLDLYHLTVATNPNLNSAASSRFDCYMTLPEKHRHLISADSHNNATGLSLQGTLADLLEAVGELQVTVPQLFHGVVTVSFALQEVSTTAALSTARETQVRVVPVNHAPTVIVEAALPLQLLEDQSSEQFPFQVADPDVTFLEQSGSPIYRLAPLSCCMVDVVLACTDCQFTIRSNGSYTHRMHITDTPAAVNKVLSEFAVVGTKDHFGHASIGILVSDFGLFGHGEESISTTIPIVIAAVNDPPLITLPLPVMLVTENQPQVVGTSRSLAPSVDGRDSLANHTQVLDVDAGALEKITLNITCEYCSFELPSQATANVEVVYSTAQVDNVSYSLVTVAGNLVDLNLALTALLYVPVPFFSGQDRIAFVATDEHSGVSETRTLEVLVRAVNNPPSVTLRSPVLEDIENSVAQLNGITVSDPDFDAVTNPTLRLEALVSASHGGVLEVQTVTTRALHIDPVQSVTTVFSPFSETNSIVGGTFTLSLDLTRYHLGVAVTDPISYDAVAMEWTERAGAGSVGARIGESMQAKLQSLSALQRLGVTVSVALQTGIAGDVVGNLTFTSVSALTTEMGSTGARKWIITFHNAGYNFPVLQVNGTSLLLQSSNNVAADVSIGVIHSGNALGGSFQLILGAYLTADIACDASGEELAAALEALPSVEAVAVTRSAAFSEPTRTNYAEVGSSEAGLEKGFTWTITFFAAHASESGDIPQLHANFSKLLGSRSMVVPGGTTDAILPATVEVATLQQGLGRPKVLALRSSAGHVNEVVAIELTTLQDASRMESFHVRVTDPVSEQTALLGPIYAATVAMAAQEQIEGTYPPHAQPAGTEHGQSIQALFRDLAFFQDFASDVSVTKLSVQINGATKVTWKVTFLESNHTSWAYSVIPGNLYASSSATVSTLQPPNRLGGSFQLSYGGHVTDEIAFDCTPEQLTSQLLHLYSLYDPQLQLGAVTASRRGPNREGAYSWYIAILQDIDFASNLSPQSVVATGLTGWGASMLLEQLRGGVSGYGIRLSRSVEGVANGLSSSDSSSLFAWSETLVLLGTPPQLTAALNLLQYQPAPHWSGPVHIIIRVSDGSSLQVSGTSFDALSPVQAESQSSAALAVNVKAVNDPSVVLWRGLPLLEEGASMTVYEDADVKLGDEVLYFRDAQSAGAISHSAHDAILVGAQRRTEPHRLDQSQGIQVSDRDIKSGAVRVTLTVSSGTISVDGVSPLRGSVTTQIVEVSRLAVDIELSPGSIASAGETLVLTGDLFAVNQQLSTLKYQSPLDANGYDYISVAVSDVEDPEVVSRAVLTVRLEPVNDPPVIHLAGVEVGALYTDGATWPVGVIQSKEDEAVPVGEFFSVRDPDFNASNFIGDTFRPDGANPFSETAFAVDTFYVSLTVTFGTLSLPYVGTALFLDSASQLEQVLGRGTLSAEGVRSSPPRNTRELFCLGSYFDLQKVLASAVYTPDADWFGVDMLNITVNDLGNIGTGGPRSLTRSIIIDVASVEDRPVIALPSQGAALRTVEDMVGVIGSDCCGWLDSASYGQSILNISAKSIQILDKDMYLAARQERVIVRSTKAFVNPQTNDPQFNTTYTDPHRQDLFQYRYDLNDHIVVENVYVVSLNVSHGVLTLPRIPPTVDLLYGAGFQDDAIVLRGALIEVNIALRGLNYVPDRNWNSLQGAAVAAAHGISTVETLHVHVVDAAGLEDRAALSIIVKPANDPPVLSIGALAIHNSVAHEADQLSRTVLKVETLQCAENADCPLQELVVRDVDASETLDGSLQVTLTARNGTFTVDPRVSRVGRFFRNNRVSWAAESSSETEAGGFAQVTFPASDISTVLDGLIYVPNHDFYGFDDITVTVDDRGNTGYGPLCDNSLEAESKPCALSDSLVIPVYVSPQPDRVEIVTPAGIVTGLEDELIVVQNLSFVNHEHIALDSLTVERDLADTFDEAVLVNISRPDRKAFFLRMSSEQGLLRLQRIPTGLIFMTGTGEFDSEIAVHGPLYLLNAAVEDLQFLPSLDLNILNAGLCSIYVTITDTADERAGTGTVRVSTAVSELKVRVLPVDDGPVVHVPGENYAVDTTVTRRVVSVVRVNTVRIDEEEEYSLDQVRVSDVDAGEYKFSAVTVSVSAQHGTFTSHNYTTAHFIEPLSAAVDTTSEQDLYGARPVSAAYRSVRLQGDLKEVNDLLVSVVYQPDLDFFGADEIAVTVCAVCLRRSGLQAAFDTSFVDHESYLNLTHTDCPACSTQRIPVAIRSVNDAPLWVVPRAPVFVTEDIAFPFAKSISIVDVDSAEGRLVVRAKLDQGAVTLPFLPHNVTLLTGTGDNDQEVTMSGTLRDLNVALASMVYVPPRNWNSVKSGIPDFLHLSVDDQGHSFAPTEVVFGQPYVVNEKIGLVAEADVVLVVTGNVAHTPYVLLPGAQYRTLPSQSRDGQLAEYQEIHISPKHNQTGRILSVDVLHVLEDTRTQILNVSFGDADEEDRQFALSFYQVNLSCNHGRLDLKQYIQFGVHVTQGQPVNGSSSLSIVGLLHNINALVARSLFYTPPADYYGPDYLTVYINDQAYSPGVGKHSNETLPIYVDSVEDAPVMHVMLRNRTTLQYQHASKLTVLEDHRLALVGINITDPDFLELPETSPRYSRDSGSEFRDRFPFSKPWDRWNVSNFRDQQDAGLLRLHITVAHGRVMLASTVGLNILSVPSVEAETERLSRYPNVVTSFTNRNHYSGTDGPSNMFDSSLGDGSGTMAGDGFDGSMSGTPRQVWWREVVLEGRLYDLNRALAVVTYWPDLNWNSGQGTPEPSCQVVRNLSVTTALGQAAGAITCKRNTVELDVINFTAASSVNPKLAPSTGSLFVNVLAVNDAPVLHFANDALYSKRLVTEDLLFAQVEDLQTQYTTEDTPLVLGNISVFDVDCTEDTFVRVNLTAVHGSVTVHYLNALLNNTLAADRGTVGLHFEAGDGENDEISIFTAPLSIVNAAISAVVFTPAPNYNGLGARLVVTVDDMGNFGSGGTKADSKTFRIIVQPANDAPQIKLPSDFGGKDIFLLDEGSAVRIQGATNQPLQELLDARNGDLRVNVTNAFQSGYEPWRFHEPLVYSTHGEFGPGRLEWSTRQVGDINPGPAGSRPRYFTNYAGQVYFQADDGIHGAELWRDYGLLQTGSKANDGSHVGDATATLFFDLMPGGRGGQPSFLHVHGDYLYFAADGTDTSWMVMPEHRDTCGSFRQSSFDSRVSFAVSQSTTWQPERVYDCPAGYHWASTEEGYRYFTSYLDGTLERFWHSEHSAEAGERHGSQEYTEVFQWERSTSLESPLGLHGHEPKTYQQQCGWDGLQWGQNTRVHFRFQDSHLTGAYKHAGKPDSYRPDRDSSQQDSGRGSLWTDHFAGIVCIIGPSPAHTASKHPARLNVSEDRAGERSAYLTGTRSQVLPLSTTAADSMASGAGNELWRTDGTTAGTLRIDDVFRGSQGSDPAFLSSFGDYLYFAATNAEEGRELWRTKGSSVGGAEMVALAGTSKLGKKGIYPGATSSNPTELTVADNYLFFAATDPYRGRELWFHHFAGGLFSEDLFNPGQLSFLDLVPGAMGSQPQGMCSSGGALPVLFQATTADSGAELWITDGTTAGTKMVRDICPGSTGSHPRYITWFRGAFYFQASDCVLGAELWTSDGTRGGTHIVKDIRPGVPDSAAAYLTVMPSLLDGKDYLFFAASDGLYNKPIHALEGVGGAQLWRTDGTTDGTVRAFDRSGNDLYFDRESLDAAYPAQFGVYKNGLYVSANYGAYDRMLPKDGFKWQSDPAAYLIDQAVVITDVDSHPTESNVTAVFRVDKGLIILDDRTQVGANSPSKFQFLVAESRLTDRVMLSNALIALGHDVETVLDGADAFARISERQELAEATSRVRQFDCVLMAVEFAGGSTRWDGLQAIRVIRDWEVQRQATASANITRIPIIAMSKLRNLINDQAEAAEAGADLLLMQTVTGYVTGSGLSERVPQSEGTSLSADLLQKANIRQDYDTFAQRVVKFLSRSSSDVLISATNSAPLEGQLPADLLLGVQDMTVGSSLSVQGTVQQVNQALTRMYYFAPNKTQGNVTFTVTVTDQPSSCILIELMQHSRANPDLVVQPATYSLLPTHGFNQTSAGSETSNSSAVQAMVAHLCDQVGAQSVTAHIPLFVTAVNQAPVLLVWGEAASNANFSVMLDAASTVPTVSVVDDDHAEGERGVPLRSSFGFEVSPPVTVSVTTKGGRVSFPVLEYQSDSRGLRVATLTAGQGRLDRHAVLRGSIDAVNHALAGMRYVCRQQDGCGEGYVDTIAVLANDEGFSGKGGALTALLTIEVAVAAAA